MLFLAEEEALVPSTQLYRHELRLLGVITCSARLPDIPSTCGRGGVCRSKMKDLAQGDLADMPLRAHRSSERLDEIMELSQTVSRTKPLIRRRYSAHRWTQPSGAQPPASSGVRGRVSPPPRRHAGKS
jgi:hypothetical protein